MIIKTPPRSEALKGGIFVRDRDTGVPLHVRPKQNLFKGETWRYFPNNNYEGKTEREIGKSIVGEKLGHTTI